VWIRGIVGAQKEAALAARRVVVTVEELVDRLDAPMNSVVLPHWVVAAVAVVPEGAHPSYAHGYYDRDNDFYIAWEEISREAPALDVYLKEWVHGVADRAEYIAKLPGLTQRLKAREQRCAGVNYGY